MVSIKDFFLTIRAILAIVLMLTGLSAFSQKTANQLDTWTVQVNNQFRKYEQQLGLSNQSHEVVTGSLDNENTEWVEVNLSKGNTYYLLGVCDNDCSDLDLKLYDSNTIISEDMASDDYPLVSVTPTADTQYRVQVVMASCSLSPCRYGLAVYMKE